MLIQHILIGMIIAVFKINLNLAYLKKLMQIITIKEKIYLKKKD
jgi:hypothetical protein